MPIQSKADGNVPFIGPKSRYNILNTSPTWIRLQMAVGAVLDGTRPRTALTDEDSLEPVISAGRAQYGSTVEGLTKGGFFSLLGNYGKAYIVEDAVLPGTVVFTIVDKDQNLIRTVTTPSYPMSLAPGEFVKLTGGTAGSLFAIKVRLEGTKIL
jgi:hypothetical protein